jgi:predicted MFS family arabinose efflux permease
MILFTMFLMGIGTMTGSYIGAKFTKRAPKIVLRISMMSIPIAGGILLLVRNWWRLTKGRQLNRSGSGIKFVAVFLSVLRQA